LRHARANHYATADGRALQERIHLNGMEADWRPAVFGGCIVVLSGAGSRARGDDEAPVVC